MWEQITMFTPTTEQVGFLIPAAALTDNRHRDQLGVCTDRRGARTCDRRGEWNKQVADEGVHPGAEVVEIAYHRNHLGWAEGVVR